MPRRRMISPDIWHDTWFGKLSHTEQVFFIGLISNSDDEGRLLAEPPYLRSRIFIYQDISLEVIGSMITKFAETNNNICVYNVNGSQYIALLKWNRYQKPNRPNPSIIPPPPMQLNESVNKSVNESMNESMPSQGQVSQVKDSIVKASTGKVDFTKCLDSEKDLTDRLTDLLTKCIGQAGGRNQIINILKHSLWPQAGKTMDVGVFDILYESLGKYPVSVLASTIAKAVKYSDSKRKPANYVQAILNEKDSKNVEAKAS